MKPLRTLSRAGFTLIELLAATAIMTVLILVVVGLSVSVVSTWTDSLERLTANQEARQAISALTSDLESVAPRSQGRAWLQVVHKTITTDEDASGTSAAAIAMRAPTIYLITHTADRPRRVLDGGSAVEIPGSLCAVVYDAFYTNPFSNQRPPRPVVSIYRGVVDAQNTFNGALALDPILTAPTHTLDRYFRGEITSSSSTPTVSTQTAPYDATKPLVTLAPNWYKDRNYLVSTNIVDFRVLFWREVTVVDTTSNPAPPPTKTLIPLTVNQLATGEPLDFLVADQIYAGPGFATTLPGIVVFADVMLTVVSEEGMIAYQESGEFSQDATGFQEMIARYGTVFNTRVSLLASGAQLLSGAL